ncbi:hypothetical protein HMPREF9303_0090 [Prevotella denticola CRIS 18C-A]|uniref:Uncharacterized protein n=1 Tax=Prevotella denticola CRIS 18C-A TaxID=944557 RepID=F0HB28_9BACT|nr:hypothetical protein HMPREF9303_0090 [Prevotella denticola CRIS 18C-A]
MYSTLSEAVSMAHEKQDYVASSVSVLFRTFAREINIKL